MNGSQQGKASRNHLHQDAHHESHHVPFNPIKTAIQYSAISAVAIFVSWSAIQALANGIAGSSAFDPQTDASSKASTLAILSLVLLVVFLSHSDQVQGFVSAWCSVAQAVILSTAATLYLTESLGLIYPVHIGPRLFFIQAGDAVGGFLLCMALPLRRSFLPDSDCARRLQYAMGICVFGILCNVLTALIWVDPVWYILQLASAVMYAIAMLMISTSACRYVHARGKEWSSAALLVAGILSSTLLVLRAVDTDKAWLDLTDRYQVLVAVSLGGWVVGLVSSADRSAALLIQASQAHQRQADDRKRLIKFLSHEARGPTNCIMLGMQEMQHMLLQLDQAIQLGQHTSHVSGDNLLSPTVRDGQARNIVTVSAAMAHMLSVHADSRDSMSSKEQTEALAAVCSVQGTACLRHRTRPDDVGDDTEIMQPGTLAVDSDPAQLSGMLLSDSVHRMLLETVSASLLACTSLREIFDSVLDAAKREALDGHLNTEPFNILQAFSATMRTYRMSLGTQSIRLVCSGIDDHCSLPNSREQQCKSGASSLCNSWPSAGISPDQWCLGDASQLNAILRNLLSNASKYSEAGSCVTVSVVIRPITPADKPKLQHLYPKHSFKSSASVARATIGKVCSRIACLSSKAGIARPLSAVKISPAPIERSLWPPPDLGHAAILELSVSDQGQGLTEEQQAGLFQEFGTVHGAKSVKQGSTGLGLHFARNTARAHGGDLVVHSAGLGQGSTFTLTALVGLMSSPALFCDTSAPATRRGTWYPSDTELAEPPVLRASGRIALASLASTPSVPAISTTVPLESSATLLRGSTTNSPTNAAWEASRVAPGTRLRELHVLIVDDTVASRKLLARAMQQRVAQVSTAADGTEVLPALRAARRACQPVHAVLLDWHMPQQNGPDTVQELRRALWPGIIIGLSGESGEEASAEWKAAGASASVTKPIDVGQLTNVLKDVLSQSDVWPTHNG